MLNSVNKFLNGYGFASCSEFLLSLVPSEKYQILEHVMAVGLLTTFAESFLGIDFLAFGALLVMMIVELGTGVIASHKRAEKFSSKKLSRFGLKVAVYLVLISVPFLFAESYSSKQSNLAAGVFEWMHIFLVIQIVLEHLISILENLGTIQGLPKDHWIKTLKEKISKSL